MTGRIPLWLLTGLALSLLSCPGKELVEPADEVRVIVHARLGRIPVARSAPVVASPTIITRMEVEVREGDGPADSLVASGGGAVVDSVADAEIMVPRRAGLYFHLGAVDAADVVQYRWVSPPQDLSDVGDPYELHDEGGGEIILDPLPPRAPTLAYQVPGAGPAGFVWDRSEEADFARYEVRGSTIPGITRASPEVYSTADRAQTALTFPYAYFPSRGTEFYCRLFVVDSEGLWTGSDEITVQVPPTLEGRAATPYDVFLDWSQSADHDFAGYEVYGSYDPDVRRLPEMLVYQTDRIDEVQLRVPVMHSDTTCFYRVFALDAEGVIAGSDVVGVDTPAAVVISYDDGPPPEDLLAIDAGWEGQELLQHIDPVPSALPRLGGLQVLIMLDEGGWGVLRPVVRAADGLLAFAGADILVDHAGFYTVEFGDVDLSFQGPYYAGFRIVQSGVAPRGGDEPLPYWGVALDTTTPRSVSSFYLDGWQWPPDPVPQTFFIRALAGTDPYAAGP